MWFQYTVLTWLNYVPRHPSIKTAENSRRSSVLLINHRNGDINFISQLRMIRAMGKILYSRLETDRLLEKIQYVSDFKAHSLLKHGKRADRYRFKNTKHVSLQGTMVVAYRPVSFCSVHRSGSTCHKCKSSIVVHGKPNIWQLLP